MPSFAENVTRVSRAWHMGSGTGQNDGHCKEACCENSLGMTHINRQFGWNGGVFRNKLPKTEGPH